MLKTNLKGFLLGAAAPAVLMVAGAAYAQSAPAEAARATAPATATPVAADASSNSGVSLGEVVVTATRTASTINKVAMSVTAVGQKDIDQKGIQNFGDLAHTVPALSFVPDATGDAAISIRGIASTVGAPTTAVYLDDAALQKRTVTIGASANGAPIPPLFDLDRVEVLRGPQGTLFGGSTMGGAVRLITPTPSLTSYSIYGKLGVSQVDGGGAGGEAGLAVGGPIVEDKLGFRASIYDKHVGGYVDHVDMFSNTNMGNNTNTQDAQSARLSLLWQATSRMKVNLSVFESGERTNDSDSWWENVPQFGVNSGTFTNTGTINGVKYSFAPKAFVGGLQGPFNMFGAYKTGNNYYANANGGGFADKQWRARNIFTPSLVVDYDFGPVEVHSATTYLSTHETGDEQGKYGWATAIGTSTFPAAPSASFVNALGQPSGSGTCGQGGKPNYTACAPLYIPGFLGVTSDFLSDDRRHSFTQEVRFSSRADAKPFSWVAGLYYDSSSDTNGIDDPGNFEDEALFVHGIGLPWTNGTLVSADQNWYHKVNYDKEEEYAAFGELNWWLTDKLKITGGVRIDHKITDLSQVTSGPGTGAAIGWSASYNGVITDQNSTIPFSNNPAACPTTNGALGCPYQLITGHLVENPVTPKYGISYQLDPGKLIYFTAAQGYRSGGIQAQPVTQNLCPVDFAQLGITQLPISFQGDSLWSYELGSKLRLLEGKAQLNSSLFYIDWKNPLITATLATCGKTYTANAPKSISRGFDMQGQWRPIHGLTLDGSVAYTNAYYTSSVISPGVTPKTIITKGDPVSQVPTWTYDIDFRYDFQLGLPEYFTMNYSYTGPSTNGAGPTDSGYDPLVYILPALHQANLRAGVLYKGMDINFWVNNVFNAQDLTGIFHQNSSALVTVTSLRPREFGLQTTFRF